MTKISVRFNFGLPFALAEEYFSEGLTRVTATGLHELQLRARIPVTAIELSKNVVAECLPDPDGAGRSWLIRWVPEPGGVYPSFEGRISAHEHQVDGTTTLQLDGSYTPPLGHAGEAFDHVLGRKITEDAAHNVLADLASEMRVRFAFEEARAVYQDAVQPEESTPAD